MQRIRLRRILVWLSAVVATIMLASYGVSQTNPADKTSERGAPLFNDLGTHQHPISRKDLERHPANGWSLYGLLASLRAQGKTEEANGVEKRFRDAWRLADITLTASSF